MNSDAQISHIVVPFDQSKDAHLVVSLTAPSIDTDVVRPKLAIVVCVDTSGSMQGQKLTYAKLSIEKLIEHLKPEDYLGIVEFNAGVKVLTKPTKLQADKKSELKKLVSGLHARGGTNFSGGMLQAIEDLKEMDLPPDYIHRVIMFTDGQPTMGPAIAPKDILKFFKANTTEQITVSTFGYGSGNGDFDPEFLADFAREGRGNYAHVENPDNALQAFGVELGGLMSTYATNIRVCVSPLGGHSIQKVVSDVESEPSDTSETWVKISDILAEETRNIVFAVKLAEQKSHGPRSVNVFEAKVFYDTFDVTGKKESKTFETKAKVRFGKSGEEERNTKLNPTIGLAVLARTQIEAEQAAKRGDFVGAQGMFRATTDSFRDQGNDALAAASVNLSARISTADSYRENQGYLQSFSRGATRGMGGSYSAPVLQDLMSLGVATQNTTQTNTSGTFTGISEVTSHAVPVTPFFGLVQPMVCEPAKEAPIEKLAKKRSSKKGK